MDLQSAARMTTVHAVMECLRAEFLELLGLRLTVPKRIRHPMKRWFGLVAATVSICFALSGTVAAQKGGGGHGSSHGTGGTSRGGSSRTVHVKEYTRK
jgi:hypothetical protein